VNDRERPRAGDAHPGAFATFLAELRRRRLGPFLIAYVAVAWVLLQLGEIVLPAFGLGDGALRILVIAVALAFPPAAALSWLFDLTRGGFKRTATLAHDSALPRLALLVGSVLVAGGAALWLRSNDMLTLSEDGSGSGSVVAPTAYDPAEPVTSLAVLPIRDNSPDASLAYLGSGMHDELSMHMGQVDGLRVVSRTSVARYDTVLASAPSIGRDLGVDALVEGSVNRSDSVLRATVRIIHAASDTQIDGFTIDTAGMDPLSFQSLVAAQAAHRMDAVLNGTPPAQPALAAVEPPTERNGPRWLAANREQIDPGSAEHYLRGVSAYRRGDDESLATATRHFEESIRRDSSFAPAFAGRAASLLLSALEDGEIDHVEGLEIMGDAGRAFSAAPWIPEVREVHSLVARTLGEDARNAVAEGPVDFRYADEPAGMDPEVVTIDVSAFDTVLFEGVTGLGRPLADRLAAFVGAGYGDPSRPDAEGSSGEGPPSRPPTLDRRLREAIWLTRTGEFREAADRLREVTESGDGAAGDAWRLLVANVASSFVEVGELGEVLVEWSASGVDGAPSAEEVDAMLVDVDERGDDAYWEWEVERLLEVEADAPGAVRRIELARAYAGAGDRERAVEYLRQSLDRGEPELFSVFNDPVWDGFRRDGEFVEITRTLRRLRTWPDPRRYPIGDGRARTEVERGPDAASSWSRSPS